MGSLAERQKNRMRIELSADKKEMALNRQQIEELVSAAAACGVTGVKLVGEDPIRFGGIFELIQGLKSIDGIDDVSLTTDGSGLSEKAKKLADSGLDRINIKVDTLKYNRVEKEVLDDMIAGINAATDAGLKPVKLNVVMKKEYNDDELMDFVQLTLQHQYEIRFIEMTEAEEAESPYQAVRTSEIRAKLPALRPGLTGEDGKKLEDPRDGTADVYMYPGARGKLCFIEKRAEDFASRCAGAFLAADGTLRQDENDREGVSVLDKTGDRETLQSIVRSILERA